ncbi:MAG: Bug family tripartite tricarboxylate transporter substrate binding protein [Beijerinckiaceae bacterium]
MSMLSRRAVTFGAAAMLASPALAQKLSDRPITIIVPFSPGSGPDLLARLAAEELRSRWGQAVVVDNRVGASGNLGAAAASRAAPDGHTLLLYVNTVLMNAALARNLPFDPVRGFQTIVELARGSLALAVHSSQPFTDTRALIAASRAKPDDLRFGSPGRGTPHHLAMELFKLRTGAKLSHIPYTGTAGVVNDFIGGHIQSMFIPVHVGLTHAKAGNIRLLALGSGKRSPLAPDVPTLAEQGVADAEVDLWYGLSAPAGTPQDIVERFNRVLNEALSEQRVRALLQSQGLEATGGTSKAFAELIEKDLPRWVSIVQSAGITAEN